jgi:hypothetical protein
MIGKVVSFNVDVNAILDAFSNQTDTTTSEARHRQVNLSLKDLSCSEPSTLVRYGESLFKQGRTTDAINVFRIGLNCHRRNIGNFLTLLPPSKLYELTPEKTKEKAGDGTSPEMLAIKLKNLRIRRLGDIGRENRQSNYVIRQEDYN